MATLQFKGKAFVQNLHLAVKYHELVPVKKKSLTDEVSLHDNLIVHGDNLKALKALLPSYAGKVKCIYIDPPYNTGNENWAYNDNVNSPMMQEWLGKVVDNEDLTRHDKWLCMMMPRLRLLRELLRDDGVIFISIDDNEVHHLRMLMDEVFGEDNHITSVVRQTRVSPDNDEKYITATHDTLVIYVKSSRNAEALRFARTVEQDARYENPDKDSRGPWTSSDLTRREYREHDYYEITLPSGRKVKPSQGRSWGVPKVSFERLVKEKRIWFGPDGDAMPRRKRFLSEVRGGVVPVSWWSGEIGGLNEEGRKELNRLFSDSPNVFGNPKPTILIQRILQLVTSDVDIVLDSFAGSGTTAHAVLALNKEDGGNRNFILIECEDYADTLTAERVRRVIKGVPKASDEALKTGLGGSFSYFELGDPLDVERLFDAKRLPPYGELARYVFFTATGREFDPKKLDEARFFIGETSEHEVYLMYKPDIEWLKKAALTLDAAKDLGKPKGKRRLVFAPTKYLEQDYLDLFKIDFAQLPFEIYRME